MKTIREPKPKNPELEQVDVNCKQCAKTIKFSKQAIRLYGDLLFCGDKCQEEFAKIKRTKIGNGQMPYRYSYYSNNGDMSLSDVGHILSCFGLKIESWGRDSKLGHDGRFVDVRKEGAPQTYPERFGIGEFEDDHKTFRDRPEERPIMGFKDD